MNLKKFLKENIYYAGFERERPVYVRLKKNAKSRFERMLVEFAAGTELFAFLIIFMVFATWNVFDSYHYFDLLPALGVYALWGVLTIVLVTILAIFIRMMNKKDVVPSDEVEYNHSKKMIRKIIFRCRIFLFITLIYFSYLSIPVLVKINVIPNSTVIESFLYFLEAYGFWASVMLTSFALFIALSGSILTAKTLLPPKRLGGQNNAKKKQSSLKIIAHDLILLCLCFGPVLWLLWK